MVAVLFKEYGAVVAMGVGGGGVCRALREVGCEGTRG